MKNTMQKKPMSPFTYQLNKFRRKMVEVKLLDQDKTVKGELKAFSQPYINLVVKGNTHRYLLRNVSWARYDLSQDEEDGKEDTNK